MRCKRSHFLTQHALHVVTAQEKFRRNGKTVDREGVAALAGAMIGRRGVPLIEDQVGVFERCTMFLGDGEQGWKALKSPCPDVEMKLKYFPPKKGERTIATGKATALIDTSAEEAAAWVFEFCSNNRMRINREEGHPTRLELREKRRVNESTMASVKRFPFLIDNREFVVRQIWKSEEGGKVWVAFESVDEKVDYGVPLRAARAFTQGCYYFENLADKYGAHQCKAQLAQHFDIKGNIPAWVVNSKVPTVLNVLQEACDEFRQDEAIDSALAKEFHTTLTAWKGEEYSEEDDALLQRVCDKFEESLNAEDQKERRRSSFLFKREQAGWR